MNKHFLNEKGITLVELLAALSLFAVVSALVMTVLFNVFRNSKNISDNAQLRQDANLLVSTLRSHYNQDDFEDFDVRLNDSKILLIKGQEVNSSMTSSIAELEINGENLISNENEEEKFVTVDGTPLSIDLTLKNEAGQTYNLFTTIEKPAELAIALQVLEEIKVPDPPDPPVRSGVYTEVFPPFYPIYIPIIDNIKYVSKDGYQLIPDDCGDITIDGHVWLSNTNPHNVVEMKHNTAKFIVTKDLFVDSVFNIHNYHPMDVEGDALFDTKLELIEKGKFIATNIHATGGDHNGNGVVVGNETRLEARQSIVVDRRFYILSSGHAEIGENLFADTVEAANDSTININGSASISNELLAKDRSKLNIEKNLIAKTVEAVNQSIIDIKGSASISNKLLAKDSSKLNIGKNLIIDGNLEMYNNVKIIVDGDARINGKLLLSENSYLEIKGDLVITGEVEQEGTKNNRTIHVEGKTNFSNGKPSWLNVENNINNDY